MPTHLHIVDIGNIENLDSQLFGFLLFRYQYDINHETDCSKFKNYKLSKSLPCTCTSYVWFHKLELL